MSNSIFIFITILITASPLHGQINGPDQTELNKEIARGFYEDLWFNNNTDRYSEYVADTYTVHDIGNRKAVIEPAIEQKKIADFFWANGVLDCQLDYQIAEGDLVATRWIADFKPTTIVGRLFIGSRPIPIINVLRIENGKIVEFWNHRHDIDTNQTMKFLLRGLIYGLIIGLIPTFFALKYRRRLKNS